MGKKAGQEESSEVPPTGYCEKDLGLIPNIKDVQDLLSPFLGRVWPGLGKWETSYSEVSRIFFEMSRGGGDKRL